MDVLPDELFITVCWYLSLAEKQRTLGHVSRAFSSRLLQLPTCFAFDEICLRFPQSYCDQQDSESETEAETDTMCVSHAREASHVRSLHRFLPLVGTVDWSFESFVSASCAPFLRLRVLESVGLLVANQRMKRLSLRERIQEPLSLIVDFCAVLQPGSCRNITELELTIEESDTTSLDSYEVEHPYKNANWGSLAHLASLRRFCWRTIPTPSLAVRNIRVPIG